MTPTMIQTKEEPKTFCLSVSRRNRQTMDAVEGLANYWNIPVGQAFFRIGREYDQLVRKGVVNI